MAQNANTTCLYTTVQNVSGSERVFGFLGVRGMRLAAGEVVTVRGDLVSKLGNQTSARRFKALERSLDERGSLKIISSPGVFLYDPINDETKQLALSGGQLGIVDPCWDSSGSSNFEQLTSAANPGT
jgi:hypothetical protein